MPNMATVGTVGTYTLVIDEVASEALEEGFT